MSERIPPPTTFSRRKFPQKLIQFYINENHQQRAGDAVVAEGLAVSGGSAVVGIAEISTNESGQQTKTQDIAGRGFVGGLVLAAIGSRLKNSELFGVFMPTPESFHEPSEVIFKRRMPRLPFRKK